MPATFTFIVALIAITTHVATAQRQQLPDRSDSFHVQRIHSDSAERCMFITPVKGGFLVAGQTTTHDRSGDLVVKKFTTDLGMAWEKNIGVPGFDLAFSGIITSTQELLLVGFAHYQSAGSLDGYAVKVSLDGEVIWRRTWGGAQDDRLIRVTELRDRNFVAIGQTASKGAGSIDGWMVKFNAQGDTLWTKTLGGALLDRTYSIAELENGDLVIAGITKANYPDDSDVLLIRTTSDGEVVWNKEVGSPQGDISHAMIPKDKGSFVSIGYTAEHSHPQSDPLLIHFSSDGHVLGSYTYQAGDEIRLMDGYFASKKLLITSGYIRSSLTDDWDAAIIHFNFKSKKFIIKRIETSEANDELFHQAPFGKRRSVHVGYTTNLSNQKSNMLLIRYTRQAK